MLGAALFDNIVRGLDLAGGVGFFFAMLVYVHTARIAESRGASWARMAPFLLTAAGCLVGMLVLVGGALAEPHSDFPSWVYFVVIAFSLLSSRWVKAQGNRLERDGYLPPKKQAGERH
jgi:hypothetical protein